ncbi:TOX high mobility group box family member 4 [Mycena sanguinolenta]|uniref:TOX high mobility group box family member 4 n=1 Tax=Mycena sanguinolenta TaxID=230812 RepID=A0A8H6Y9Q7_9AGAR|nr:TOX high mobility group box family member 4 [Mycena sanguinolenta]
MASTMETFAQSYLSAVFSIYSPWRGHGTKRLLPDLGECGRPRAYAVRGPIRKWVSAFSCRTLGPKSVRTGIGSTFFFCRPPALWIGHSDTRGPILRSSQRHRTWSELFSHRSSAHLRTWVSLVFRPESYAYLDRTSRRTVRSVSSQDRNSSFFCESVRIRMRHRGHFSTQSVRIRIEPLTAYAVGLVWVVGSVFFLRRSRDSCLCSTMSRTYNPDTRPLPPGWITQFDPDYNTWFYVNTQAQPPTPTWNHPLDSPAPTTVYSPPQGPPPNFGRPQQQGILSGLLGWLGFSGGNSQQVNKIGNIKGGTGGEGNDLGRFGGRGGTGEGPQVDLDADAQWTVGDVSGGIGGKGGNGEERGGDGGTGKGPVIAVRRTTVTVAVESQAQEAREQMVVTQELVEDIL